MLTSRQTCLESETMATSGVYAQIMLRKNRKLACSFNDNYGDPFVRIDVGDFCCLYVDADSAKALRKAIDEAEELLVLNEVK